VQPLSPQGSAAIHRVHGASTGMDFVYGFGLSLGVVLAAAWWATHD
jgi:hypothetical protein